MVSVMMLGDSTTLGVRDATDTTGRWPTLGGYRTTLYDLLADAGFAGGSFDFVGSRSNGPATVDGRTFDGDNEAYPGIQTNQLFNRLPTILSDADAIPDPDIVLLMIGSNDLYQWDRTKGDPAAAAKFRVGRMIDAILSQAPGVEIFVATPPLPLDIPDALDAANRWPGATSASAAGQAWNDGVEAAVAQRANPRVNFVDMEALFAAGRNMTPLASDASGLHPTDEGYRAIANAWFTALRAERPDLFPDNPPPEEDVFYFGGSAYVLGTPGLSWTAAQAEAQARGGRIVEIDSLAENQFVVSTFGGAAPIWIGLSDAAVEGQFRAASGAAPTFTYWLSGQPDNGGGADYALIGADNGRWDDQGVAGGWFRAGGVWRGGYQTVTVIELPAKNDRFYFNGSAYKAGTPGLSWTAAQAEARAMGGKLVEIDSLAENQFVVSTFGGTAPIWIGLSDAAVEGQFRTGSGAAPAFTYWLSGQPDNGGGADYALIAADNGRWDDQTDGGGWFRAGGVWRGGHQTISVIEFDGVA